MNEAARQDIQIIHVIGKQEEYENDSLHCFCSTQSLRRLCGGVDSSSFALISEK